VVFCRLASSAYAGYGAQLRRLLTPRPGRGVGTRGRELRTEEDCLLGARVASSLLGLLDSCKVQLVIRGLGSLQQRLPLFAITIPPLRTIDVWNYFDPPSPLARRSLCPTAQTTPTATLRRTASLQIIKLQNLHRPIILDPDTSLHPEPTSWPQRAVPTPHQPTTDHKCAGPSLDHITDL
jgi:hypothetical protein